MFVVVPVCLAVGSGQRHDHDRLQNLCDLLNWNSFSRVALLTQSGFDRANPQIGVPVYGLAKRPSIVLVLNFEAAGDSSLGRVQDLTYFQSCDDHRVFVCFSEIKGFFLQIEVEGVYEKAVLVNAKLTVTDRVALT